MEEIVKKKRAYLITTHIMTFRLEADSFTAEEVGVSFWRDDSSGPYEETKVVGFFPMGQIVGIVMEE